MEIVLSLYTLMFWAAIGFVVLGGILGLVGVWIPKFWEDEVAIRLLLTDAILAGTSIAVALIIRWLQ